MEASSFVMRNLKDVCCHFMIESYFNYKLLYKFK